MDTSSGNLFNPLYTLYICTSVQAYVLCFLKRCSKKCLDQSFLLAMGYERFAIASVLVLDKFCIFILNSLVIFLLTMVKFL